MTKNIRYLWYVLRHKYFVGEACFRRGLFWRGLVHDLSKFRPDEFGPYAQYFYGPNAKARKQTPEEKQAFDLAWLKHQHRNDHHWQHWVLREDSGDTKYLEMPKRCVLEMLADWEGAGMAITGKREYRHWYAKNKDKILLHPNTQTMVLLFLGVS